MQKPSTISVAAGAVFMTAALLSSIPGGAQTPPSSPAQAQKEPPQGQATQQPTPPKPYKKVSVTLAPSITDPGLDALRKQLADIAGRKDRAALGRLVSKDFFWDRENGNSADKNKPGIDNLATVAGLDAKDGSGWQTIADYAGEPSASAMEGQKDVACSPATPVFNEDEFKALLQSTQTDPGEWGYALRDGIEIRESAAADGKVVEKLGLQFVRVMPDPAASDAKPTALRVVAPSGKLGFIPLDSVFPLGIDQLCYKKEADGWKIAGYLGAGAATE